MSKFYFIILPVFFSQISFGQVNYGFKFGVNASGFRINEYKIANYKAGYNGGVVMQFSLAKNSFIQGEILYSEKGYKRTGDYPNTTYLDWVAIPVLYGYSASGKLSVLAGVEFAMLLSEDRTPSAWYQDMHKKIDLGLAVGLAYKITRQFGVDARYSYGILPNAKVYVMDSNGNIVPKNDGNNRCYQLNLFYLISKSK